jgi:hypothetical protein
MGQRIVARRGRRGTGDVYVRPVTSGSQPRHVDWSVWRFRLVALVLLALFVLLVSYFITLANPERQNPGVGLGRPGPVAAIATVA